MMIGGNALPRGAQISPRQRILPAYTKPRYWQVNLFL